MKYHLKDIRIHLTKIFVILAFLFCTLITIMADIEMSRKALLTLTYSALAGTALVGFHLLRNKKAEILIFMLMVVYIWIAHPIKVALTVLDPMTSWVSYDTFAPSIVKNEIAEYFFIIAPGLITFFLGIILSYKLRESKNTGAQYRTGHVKFSILILSLLGLRLVNQTVLQIGLPGVRPPSLGIPYLTGILELLSRPVLFALVNFYFYSILKLNEPRGLSWALLLILANVFLGLWVGYKSELILQGFFLAYYLFGLRREITAARRRLLYTLCAALVISTVILFPLINIYRSYLLSGKDISQAVKSAEKAGARQEYSFISSFLNRVNGTDAFYVASKLGEGREFPLSSLMDASVMDLIKEQKYGLDKDKAVTAFGTTQFSVLYLVGGQWLLYFGSFVCGWLMAGIASFLRSGIYKSALTFEAYLPFYSIWCVKLLSSGGDLALYLKELALVVIFLLLAERFCMRRSRKTVLKPERFKSLAAP